MADFVKNTDFNDKLKNSNKKITSKRSKHLLVENELKNQKIKENLQAYDSSLFISQSHFFNDGAEL